MKLSELRLIYLAFRFSITCASKNMLLKQLVVLPIRNKVTSEFSLIIHLKLVCLKHREQQDLKLLDLFRRWILQLKDKLLEFQITLIIEDKTNNHRDQKKSYFWLSLKINDINSLTFNVEGVLSNTHYFSSLPTEN